MTKPKSPDPRPDAPKPARKGAAARPEPGAASDPDKGERLARRLARAGVASRRAAEAIIAEGRVRVNGKVVESPALNVTPDDLVELDGAPLAAPERTRMWRYHKPSGLVTSEADEKGRATVFDNLPPDLPRVMSVGRLDLNSEGLLLLTNDGDLKRRLELPSTGWLRKYRVRVFGAPDEKALEPLRKGMVVEGERFQPMTASVDRIQGRNAWLTVSLREGRNREVRKALGALGFEVSRLIRVSYGPFLLGELAAGEVEEIRPKVMRDQLGLGPAPKESRAPGSGVGAGMGGGRTDPDEDEAPRRRPGPPRGRSPGPGRPGLPKPEDARPGRAGGRPGAGPARGGKAGTGKAGTGKAGTGWSGGGARHGEPEAARDDTAPRRFGGRVAGGADAAPRKFEGRGAGPKPGGFKPDGPRSDGPKPSGERPGDAKPGGFKSGGFKSGGGKPGGFKPGGGGQSRGGQSRGGPGGGGPTGGKPRGGAGGGARGPGGKRRG